MSDISGQGRKKEILKVREVLPIPNVYKGGTNMYGWVEHNIQLIAWLVTLNASFSDIMRLFGVREANSTRFKDKIKGKIDTAILQLQEYPNFNAQNDLLDAKGIKEAYQESLRNILGNPTGNTRDKNLAYEKLMELSGQTDQENMQRRAYEIMRNGIGKFIAVLGLQKELEEFLKVFAEKGEEDAVSGLRASVDSGE